MIRAAILSLSLLFIPFTVMAQEAAAPQVGMADPRPPKLVATPHKLDSKKYSPDYCEFTANFPEEPLVNNFCEKEDDPSTCYNLISYTKVLEMASTINVEIICNPATPEMFAEFTPQIMEDTVRKMTEGNILETLNINTREEEGYRQTGLIGRGRKGLDDTIYLSQLWVSEQSIMSVEAEMSGVQTEEADKLFADILRSIGYEKEIEESGENSETKEQEAIKAP